jgi:hypothetical protein
MKRSTFTTADWTCAARLIGMLCVVFLVEFRGAAQTSTTLQVPDIATNPDVIPLRDYVVIEFKRPLDELKNRYKCGVFRNEEPREIQWIEERSAEAKLLGFEHPFHFLQLHYEVPGFESYNGWWLRLDRADWTALREWDFVVRLRAGEMCTEEFKVELKAIPKGSQSPERYAAIVSLLPAHRQELAAKGFVDYAIPMRLFVGQADVSQMYEFVVVFENSRVTAKKGDMLIHSVRLSPPTDDDRKVDVEVLLDRLGRRAFQWFEEHRDEKSGLLLDRSPNSPGRRAGPKVASMASAGYYLSMLPEAVRTGQLSRDEAEQRAALMLDHVRSQMAHHHGLLYHFVDRSTGMAEQGSEVSCLDSAIFFNGCIVVAEAFDGSVGEAANALVDRADWSAFIVEHSKTQKELLALGWKPKVGLLQPMDVRSSEMAMAYFLAVGSRTHPIDPQCWYNTSTQFRECEGRKTLNPTHPLFTSYYGLGWHQLSGLVDKDGVDLDRNASEASRANRDFCRLLQQRYVSYSTAQGGWWGISAGDSPRGYVAPGLVFGDSKGTVWPLSSLAALPWIPSEVKGDLHNWRKSSVWSVVSGPYGLGPFNLDEQWIGGDVIGIDLGSFYINLANYRNGTVRDLWMKHPVAKSALERLGFRKSP